MSDEDDDDERAETDEPPERPAFLATDAGGVVFLALVFVSLAIPLSRALLSRETFGWAATCGILSALAIPLLLVHLAARARRPR